MGYIENFCEWKLNTQNSKLEFHKLMLESNLRFFVFLVFGIENESVTYFVGYVPLYPGLVCLLKF